MIWAKLGEGEKMNPFQGWELLGLLIPLNTSPDLGEGFRVRAAQWLTLIPPWWQGGLVIAWLGFVLLLAQTLYRVAPTSPEIVRKTVHIGSGNVILLAWWLNFPAVVGVAAAILAAFMAVLSYFLPIMPSINSVGRQSWGTFFYAVSIGVLIAWFWPLEQPVYAALGILVMAWGDGLAGAIGQRFGQHPYQLLGQKKSWEGSLTMAAVSFVVALLLLTGVEGSLWQTGLVAGAIALVATALETLSFLGIDNLTVPLGSAAVGFFLTQIL